MKLEFDEKAKQHSRDLLNRVVDSFMEIRMAMIKGDMLLTVISENLKENKIHPAHLADIGYVFRVIQDLSDEMRKEHYARQEAIAFYLCEFWVESVTEACADPDAELYVDEKGRFCGNFARAYPQVKRTPVLPHPNNAEAWRMFCDYLGIPAEVRERGLIRWHYPSVAEWLNDHLEVGAPNPPGLDKTYPKKTSRFLGIRHRTIQKVVGPEVAEVPKLMLRDEVK